jgi:hypothetical protein
MVRIKSSSESTPDKPTTSKVKLIIIKEVLSSSLKSILYFTMYVLETSFLFYNQSFPKTKTLQNRMEAFLNC